MKRPMTAAVSVFLLVASAACSPAKVDQQKFDALNRAGRTVKENTVVGVNLIKFRDVISMYATEVSLGQDRAASKIDKTFVGLHEEALKAYRDSLTVWNLKIEKRDNGLAAYPHTELRRIVDDNGLDGKFSGTNFMFDADPAIQKIWTNARLKLDAADAMYRGDAEPVTLPSPH